MGHARKRKDPDPVACLQVLVFLWSDRLTFMSVCLRICKQVTVKTCLTPPTFTNLTGKNRDVRKKLK